MSLAEAFFYGGDYRQALTYVNEAAGLNQRRIAQLERLYRPQRNIKASIYKAVDRNPAFAGFFCLYSPMSATFL